MESEGQREMYLRKAQEAEVEEGKATRSQARWAWEKIVVGYLELAEMCAEEEPAEAA